MTSLVESGTYGFIKTTDTSINGFYVIMFTSGAYKLQENTTIDGKILIERKWTERKYHVQDNAAVKLKHIKMYCNTN